VGCVYYSKNISDFPKKNKIRDSPADLLFKNGNDLKKWIEDIRRHLDAFPVVNEEKLIPTYDALHWLRASYVVKCWSFASLENPEMPKITEFGWSIDSGQRL